MKYLSLAALLIATAQPMAHAADTHAIDMTTVLRDDSGRPAKNPFDRTKEDPDCAKCALLTLGTALYHALVFPIDSDRQLDAGQMWALGALAQKVKNEPSVNLTAFEIVKIEERIGKVFGIPIVAQVIPILEPGRAAPELK